MTTEARKMKVIFRGPLLSQSGYGTHGRQIARWLIKLQDQQTVDVDFDIVPWGITPWHVDPSACDGLIGRIFQSAGRKNGENGYDLSLQLQLPNEWDPFLAAHNVGITAAVETDRCNPVWIDAINRMDNVVVPSEFTKSVLSASGDVTTPVTVIPESWLEACRGASRGNSVLNDKLNLETDFNFLVVSQFTGNNPDNDRKNLAWTLKWILEEFKDDPDCGLIIKTNFGRQTKLDQANCLKTLAQIVMECKQGPGPKIYMMHGHMSDEEIVGLYTHPKIKALVSLTRGEGFGLPLLEAAACGLPVVATGWSAHTEFLGRGKYIKVDYGINQIHPSRVDERIFMPEARWAAPDEADAKRKMGRFRRSHAVPTKWATELQSDLQKAYSPEAVEAQYDEFLKLVAKSINENSD